MPHFGHPIDEMIRSFRNNRELLARRKRLKDFYAEKGLDHLKKNNLDKFKAPENVLENIRRRMQRRNRISLISRWIIFFFISAASLIIFMQLFF